MFKITEDDLTNAIFYNVALESVGSGSKEEARVQARRMLASLENESTEVAMDVEV